MKSAIEFTKYKFRIFLVLFKKFFRYGLKNAILNTLKVIFLFLNREKREIIYYLFLIFISTISYDFYHFVESYLLYTFILSLVLIIFSLILEYKNFIVRNSLYIEKTIFHYIIVIIIASLSPFFYKLFY